MRILTPLWMLPIGLSTLALTGCGDQDASDAAREQVILATDRASAAASMATALPEEDRVYSKDSQRNGVEVPADFSDDALRLDRMKAAVPGLEAASGAAGPLQKYSIARSLSDIYRSEAEYLSTRASESLVDSRSQLIRAQSYYHDLKRINSALTKLRGSRAEIIETFQTGEIGGNVPAVDGLDAIKQRAQELESKIQAARSAMRERVNDVEELVDSRQELDSLSGELNQEAASLQGDSRFDKIDQAIRAWEQARLAEAGAETELILARTQFILTGLSVGDVMDPAVQQAVFTALSDAGVQAASNIEVFRQQMPQAMLALENGGAQLKDAAFSAYRNLNSAAQRDTFDQQVAKAIELAPDFIAIEQSSNITKTLAGYEDIIEASTQPGTLQAYQAVIRDIESRISEVRAEIEAAERERQAAETRQSEVAADFNALINELDAEIQVLAIDRFQAALDAISKSEEQLQNATPTAQLQTVHNLDLAAVYLQHVRIQHDMLIGLRSYQTVLNSFLAANASGTSILGQTTVDTIQQLASDLDQSIDDLAAEAETTADSFRSTVTGHMEELTSAAGTEGSEAERVSAIRDQLQTFWSNMQQ